MFEFLMAKNNLLEITGFQNASQGSLLYALWLKNIWLSVTDTGS